MVVRDPLFISESCVDCVMLNAYVLVISLRVEFEATKGYVLYSLISNSFFISRDNDSVGISQLPDHLPKQHDSAPG